jgi:hypothetical protein
LGDAGYGVVTVATTTAAREAFRRESFALFFIADGAVDGIAHLAAEAEDRRVRTVIMAQSEGVLDALRAKGLICFQCPASLDDLKSAVHARL